MAKAFLSIRDCNMRIDQTICSYEGQPVWVRVYDVDPLNVVRIAPPSSWENARSYRITKVEDPAFSLTPVDLGYVNLTTPFSRCVYTYRNSQRRPRQGLSIDNINIVNRPEDVNSAGLMTCPGFADMWSNKYPSLSECVSAVSTAKTEGFSLNRSTPSMAFHKHFAIQKEKEGVYRVDMQGYALGLWNEQHHTFKFTATLPSEEQKDLSVVFMREAGVPINEYA